MKSPFRIFNRKSRQPRTTQAQSFVTRTASAVHVSAETAKKSSAVYAGIRYLGQTLGQLPCCAYKQTRDGKREKLTEARYAPLNAMIRDMANPRLNLSWQKVMETIPEHCILYGNFVAEIERDGAGRAIALYVLDPDKLVFSSPNGEDLQYEYNDPRRGKIYFTPDEVFHVSNFGCRHDLPSVGVSTIEYAAQSIGWQQATELFGASYFANGIHPSVLITMKNSLTPEAYKLFTEELNAKFSGSRGSHQPFVTDGEVTVERLSVQPDDAQFVQTLQHQLDDIARWIGVPPSKVGHLVHSGVRANVEHASIEVIRDAVMPWVRRVQTEATSKFFTLNESHLVRLDLTALMEGDSAARADYFRTMRNLGAMNTNEIREREGMNPIGEDGDNYIVQGQYILLSQVGREPTSSQNIKESSSDDERQDPNEDPRPTGGSRAEATLSDEEAVEKFRRTLHLQRD